MDLNETQIQTALTLLLRDTVHDLSNWLESQRALGAERLPLDADKSWGIPGPALSVAAPVSAPVPRAEQQKSAPVLTQPEQPRTSRPADAPNKSMASFMAMRETQAPRQLFTTAERQMAIDVMNARCRACRQCVLGAKRRGVLCGYGPADADLMFVAAGANPGELDAGRIMTGDAAALFDKIVLAMAELKPAAASDSIYMTNIIKCACTPARNQVSECAVRCLGFVREEVQIVQPKVIVVWGQMAYRAMFGSDALISQVRGSLLNFEGVPAIATHHPMEMIKQPNLKRRVWEDLKMAASYL
ncbi:MAG: uracil-DNA glycosylase [Proteobacteria bacterium]|nr:uracil-DNA glycosylase [Pseudomonadota bacterium]